MQKKNDIKLIGEYINEPVFTTIGKYGPYIKYDNKNYSIPKQFLLSPITLDKCIKIIDWKDEHFDIKQQKPSNVIHQKSNVNKQKIQINDDTFID